MHFIKLIKINKSIHFYKYLFITLLLVNNMYLAMVITIIYNLLKLFCEYVSLNSIFFICIRVSIIIKTIYN